MTWKLLGMVLAFLLFKLSCYNQPDFTEVTPEKIKRDSIFIDSLKCEVYAARDSFLAEKDTVNHIQKTNCKNPKIVYQTKTKVKVKRDTVVVIKRPLIDFSKIFKSNKRSSATTKPTKTKEV